MKCLTPNKQSRLSDDTTNRPFGNRGNPRVGQRVRILPCEHGPDALKQPSAISLFDHIFGWFQPILRNYKHLLIRAQVLKTSSFSFMSTPLADDRSLYHSDYLLGPVETIVCSHQALASGLLSVHDITEAYRTLSMRIRQLSCHLSAISDAFPALNPLRDKGAEVVAALRRDVSWALPISAAHTSRDLSLRSSGPTAEVVCLESTISNRATDSSTLCHYALRLLSEIFRLPALSSVFACTSHCNDL